MRNLVIGLVLFFTAQTSFAFERAFRIDKYFPVTNGYAVAWGIPGKNLDFEWLDTLSYEEVSKKIDIPSVRNFIVDVESNKILATVGANDEDRDEYVVFNVGDTHFGNHYGVSLNKLAIQNIGYNTEALVVTENYKWFDDVSTILLVNRDTRELKTTEIDAQFTMELLRKKLKESILPKNLQLFEDASESVHFEVKFLENIGDVNVITLDYSYPKSMDNSLEVVATVKMKYENGKVVPYVLAVKQKQY